MLGFRFAPRTRDLADKRLYVPGKAAQWPALSALIGASIYNKLIEEQFAEALRLAASIQQGTVTASLILRKMGAYPRQNSLAMALREIGRIERTLFTLAWLQDPALRRRVTAGLNKGEARNFLPGLCSSTGWAKSATIPSRINSISPAVSTWWSPRSRCGHDLPGTRRHAAWKISGRRYGLA
ncbi:MAG: Tn3 family transposase, partial [Bryobacterales bacterium]|nr:Tn3 family transposase [Bryobacterales bacterium]